MKSRATSKNRTLVATSTSTKSIALSTAAPCATITSAALYAALLASITVRNNRSAGTAQKPGDTLDCVSAALCAACTVCYGIAPSLMSMAIIDDDGGE